MRNISNMLGRGNLTPRERFLLLIQNDVHRYKTGKDALTAADKQALESWHAKTNEEAREWNRLNEGWKYIGRIDLEVEFIFSEAQHDHFRVRPLSMELLTYPYRREIKKMVENIKNIKKVTAVQAAEIFKKQRDVKLRDGVDFEYAVYQRAFERLSPEDRQKLVELYPDVGTDHQYLDEEEVIAHLLAGKETLTPEAKAKLADLVAEKSYNAFAKEYQLFHYFACFPLAEVARHFLESKGVELNGKLLSTSKESGDKDYRMYKRIEKAALKYADENKVTIASMLKEGFISWYDKGLPYSPLVISDDKELFERWIKTKIEARKELHELIRQGELCIRERAPEETRLDKLYSKGLHDREYASAQQALELLELPEHGGELDEKKAFETFSNTVITGESLCKFSGNFEFVQDFKKRADEYDPNLGIAYADDDPKHTGEHLDQELLICDLNDKGEAGVFSLFGITLMRLEGLLNCIEQFKKEKKDGEALLKFKNEELEGLFKKARVSFIRSYGKLLAIRGLLQKLEAIYEADLTFRINDLLGYLDDYIESHNEALRLAVRQLPTFKDDEENDKLTGTNKSRGDLGFDQNLLIDKGNILPNDSVVKKHIVKLGEILGQNAFSS